MFRALQAWNSRPARASSPWLAVLASLLLLAGCSGMGDLGAGTSTSAPPPPSPNIGTGKVKVGLILPLSATGNAAVAAQSMRNAAEMALAEFNNPDLQLLVKDDGGTAQGAQQVAQQVLDEGAEIILGPLFALTVGPVGRAARARNVPVIAFSTDANVAARGVYLLSFLPESDVERIIGYAASQGRRSFAALIPDNAYGSVAEGAFKQAVARRDGRVVALERYPGGQGEDAGAGQDRGAGGDGGEPGRRDLHSGRRRRRACGGADPDRQRRRSQTRAAPWHRPVGGWADLLQSAARRCLVCRPDSTGFRNFSGRYRSRYGQDPVRTASLAYDAVALVAALVKTQGQQRFSESVLTTGSGFTGIDGLFRFRPDGTNQRGLAVMKVSPTGGQIISAPPKDFAGSGT